ncbi:MAG: hypothetical protein Q7T82_13645 [Armatimonadota bacterium]|nr:hypothetical protein [Armatimonadota bacterium]
MGLSRYARFTGAGIAVSIEDIAEVRSHDHTLLQCLDVVLGAMAFRLNDRHKNNPPGARHRGKRTKAKEKLYQFILAEVRKIFPNFNIGITTGIQGDYENRWRHPYSHWLFMPNDTSYEKALTKRGRTTNDPTRPT